MKTIHLIYLFLTLSFTAFAQQETKPNVLFIFADDQTFESLGALNNNEIKTPNLDRLMARGTVFSHAFNMGSWSPAVCVASRAMINTGKYVWTTAAYEESLPMNGEKYMPSTDCPDVIVERQQPEGYWSEFMKEAGYDTYMTGKWHVHVEADSVFDFVKDARGGMPTQSKIRYERTFIKGEKDIWSPYDKSMGGFWKGGKHWSEVVGDHALSFIDQAKDDEDPFFMYLAFNAPHDPRQSPKKYVDMYDVDDITLPANFIPEYPYNEEIGSGRTLRDERLAPFPRTEYAVKVNRQEYYAIITHMDAQIGRILDALEASGKADNTYIFFTADHGIALGDHGFTGKQNLYDRSIRVPLIAVGPTIKAEKVIDEKVYLQDVMATALDIADSKAVDAVDFKSLMPLWTGESKKGYDAIYGGYLGSQRMIRTDRYKMLIYPGANVVRLYDIKKDPEEMVDLASNKKYKKVMDKLFVQFQELQKTVSDPVDVTTYYNKFFSEN